MRMCVCAYVLSFCYYQTTVKAYHFAVAAAIAVAAVNGVAVDGCCSCGILCDFSNKQDLKRYGTSKAVSLFCFFCFFSFVSHQIVTLERR